MYRAILNLSQSVLSFANARATRYRMQAGSWFGTGEQRGTD